MRISQCGREMEPKCDWSWDAKFIGFLIGLLCWVLVLRRAHVSRFSDRLGRRSVCPHRSHGSAGTPLHDGLRDQPIGSLRSSPAGWGAGRFDRVNSVHYGCRLLFDVGSVAVIAKRCFGPTLPGSWRLSAFPVLTLGLRACREHRTLLHFFNALGFLFLVVSIRIPNWTAEKRCSTRSPPA